MKFNVLLVFGFLLSSLFCQGQASDIEREMVVLAKVLADYNGAVDMKGYQRELNHVTVSDLDFAKELVDAVVMKRRSLLGTEILHLQDSSILKQVYAVTEISKYVLGSSVEEGITMVKQILSKNRAKEELLVNYYNFVFSAIVRIPGIESTKKKQFGFAELGLMTDQEKGIFFLTAISAYAAPIQMAIAEQEPERMEKAGYWINNLPKFDNEKPYYYFSNFDFPDFKIKVGQYQSFKSFYLQQYYEFLLGHMIVLKTRKNSKEDIDDLKANSVLLDSRFYNYLETDTKEILVTMKSGGTISKGLTAADEAYETGDYPLAIRLYKGAWEKEAKPQVLNKLAASYLQAKNYADANKAFSEFISLEAASPEGYYGLAQTQHAQGEWADALRNAKRALSRSEELAPKRVPAIMGLMGMIYLDMGDTKNAKSYLKKAQKEGFVVPEVYAKKL